MIGPSDIMEEVEVLSVDDTEALRKARRSSLSSQLRIVIEMKAMAIRSRRYVGLFKKIMLSIYLC